MNHEKEFVGCDLFARCPCSQKAIYFFKYAQQDSNTKYVARCLYHKLHYDSTFRAITKDEYVIGDIMES